MISNGIQRPAAFATLTTEGSTEVSRLQTGSLATYAFVMLIGLVVLVGLYLVLR